VTLADRRPAAATGTRINQRVDHFHLVLDHVIVLKSGVRVIDDVHLAALLLAYGGGESIGGNRHR
jgi:hypothetical protein